MVNIVTPPPVVVDPPAVAEPPLRKRLPAYGRTLLQARRMRRHPREVTVFYGPPCRGPARPRLWIDPDKYKPGRIDWRVVAGVKVNVYDRAGGLADFDIERNRFGAFYTMLGELVAARAYVEVFYPEGDRWQSQPADVIAYACRDLGRWPCWWSDDLERMQRAAFSGYLGDMSADIAGAAA